MTEDYKTVSTERGLLTEINGIMFDQLSVEQLQIWARTIQIDQDEDSFIEDELDITISQLVEVMNSAFLELKINDPFISFEHWACDGKIVGACFPPEIH